MGVYLAHQYHLYGTNQLLRHFRSFLRQDECKLAYNPESDFREPMNKDYAAKRVRYLVNVAINRKAGIPDDRTDLAGIRRDWHHFQEIRKYIGWGYIDRREVISRLKFHQCFRYHDEESNFGVWPGLTGARVYRKLLERECKNVGSH